jgi:hypothetical protein
MNRFYARQAAELRVIAATAQPAMKKRLLELAEAYEARPDPLGSIAVNSQEPSIMTTQATNPANE